MQSRILKGSYNSFKIKSFSVKKIPKFLFFSFVWIWLSFSMIWFCMQKWDKVRILNQTRAVFLWEKESGTTYASTRKKLIYISQSLYCNSLPKGQIKNPFCSFSIGRFCLIQEIFNLHARCNECNEFHHLPVPFWGYLQL